MLVLRRVHCFELRYSFLGLANSLLSEVAFSIDTPPIVLSEVSFASHSVGHLRITGSQVLLNIVIVFLLLVQKGSSVVMILEHLGGFQTVRILNRYCFCISHKVSAILRLSLIIRDVIKGL